MAAPSPLSTDKPALTTPCEDNTITTKPERGSSAQLEDWSSSNTLLEIRPPPLSCPKSAYAGHEPPDSEASERRVVDYFLPEDVDLDDDDDDIDLSDLMVLDDFVVYRDHSDNPRDPTYLSFVALTDVAIKQGGSTFFFDGVVRGTDREHRPKTFYIKRISFALVTISGYEDVERHTVGDDLWIQSTHCRARGDIWYRLGTPAPEYAQYNKLFSWVADLSKHLIDYFYMHPDTGLHLTDFETRFADWLLDHHGKDPTFMEWYSEYDKRDFRHALVAHSVFLHKHASDLDRSYLEHPVWGQIGLSLGKPAIKEHPATTRDTVVTPYVYQCFKNMPWSSHLKVVNFNNKALHAQRLNQMKFEGGRPKKPAVQSRPGGSVSVPGKSLRILPGDVIATPKDQGSAWKGGEEHWYALVQDIDVSGSKRQARLYVIWLYHSTDTVCADLTYPHSNELFLSDHCNCAEGHFDIGQVAKKVPVTFSTRKPANNTGFFARQTYHSVDETFTTLRKKDFLCECRQTPSTPSYEPGDTVLVEAPASGELRLEPAEVVTASTEDDNIELRELLRRNRDFGETSASPNELVYTDRFRTVKTEQIHRMCHVRFYTEEDKQCGRIPTPYDRDGNGDAFYILTRESFYGCVEPFKPPTQFKLGFDPQQSQKKLRGLNIFSGGGNFDRGLEEGSAIQSEWAVEWCQDQMLTYRANHSEPDKLKLFCGSVNDYLMKAANGSSDRLIAGIGEVEFLSAGSPCQGYSPVNFQKQSEGSMRNSSMVASVAAFIDLYRPKYAILENVTSMASKQVEPSPFSQLLCSFVGMGYQLRILNLDAWSFGAPQSRSRLFVVIAAPGLELPQHPALTHSHTKTAKRRSLGEAPNGLPFGERHFDVPVFDYVSAADGTKNLASIGQGKVMMISDPDHRPARIESTYNQNIINSVPKAPRTNGLQDALKLGWISASHADSTARLLEKQTVCRSWSRVHPRQLIGTVTTAASPSCRFTGRWLHWFEDRVISVKEARRAQGFPDSEVIVGKPSQQWKIIGNSVARQVALALGVSVRDACLNNARTREKVRNQVAGYSHASCDFDFVSQPETAGSPSSTIVTGPSDDKSQHGEPETSNTSVSPDPISSVNAVVSRKRGVHVLDEVVVPTANPRKQLKSCG